jgi:hypothetical protein
MAGKGSERGGEACREERRCRRCLQGGGQQRRRCACRESAEGGGIDVGGASNGGGAVQRWCACRGAAASVLEDTNQTKSSGTGPTLPTLYRTPFSPDW